MERPRAAAGAPPRESLDDCFDKECPRGQRTCLAGMSSCFLPSELASLALLSARHRNGQTKTAQKCAMERRLVDAR